MRFEIFSISSHGDPDAAAALNRFLAAHAVVDVDRRLIEENGRAFWTFCVVYRPAGESSRASAQGLPTRRDRIDYREALSPEDFTIYCRLRELRKSIASAESIPPYAVFNNEQLAAIVTGRVTSKDALAAIDGVGQARVDKYGERFIAMMRASLEETAIGASNTGDGQRPASAQR